MTMIEPWTMLPVHDHFVEVVGREGVRAGRLDAVVDEYHHDPRCPGDCGPCGGTGGDYGCFACGGSGRCAGCNAYVDEMREGWRP